MSWIHTVLDLLLPDTCVLCRAPQNHRKPHLMCSYCWGALPRLVHGCPGCALPLPSPGLCGRCQRKPLLSGVCIAGLRHEGDARSLVHQLKYAHDLRAGITLAQVLSGAVTQSYADRALPQCLIPVPLSYPRQVHRGFNQAAWLANCAARSLALPVNTSAVRRRHGRAQQTLSRRARLSLAADTFSLGRKVDYQHVAIVDDVFTTGTTTAVLADMLRHSGIATVDIWVAARAIPD